MVTQQKNRKWQVVVDIDRCTGCQACVVACQAENNIPLNSEDIFDQRRAVEWIRIERYWEGEFPNVKARFMPVLCQHCDVAPCEPVCPVFATYHNNEGLNVQVYNRCIGTRYCANNCPYHVRFFNFWDPKWPDSLKNQLNPDVTVQPACAQACPTGTLVFGDANDPNSRVSRMSKEKRGYLLLESLGTKPNVTYLKKVDPHAVEGGHGA